VTAVEPGDAMAVQFRRVLPDVPIVRGDGNALPLADSSHDLITYAQSWHWTDINRSVPEALRVLRLGGALAIWWNTSAFDAPWIQAQHFFAADACSFAPRHRRHRRPKASEGEAQHHRDQRCLRLSETDAQGPSHSTGGGEPLVTEG
jgi:ubiquinone/menaquinone biosynthesis C-methylase UbiE